MKLTRLDNADVGALIAVLFVLGFAVAWPLLGFWEAVRGFAVEAVILGASFWLARQYLPWEDAPRERIKNPRVELILGLLGFAAFFVVWPLLTPVEDSVSLFLNLLLAMAALGAFAVAAMLPLRYPLKAWGLRMPTLRELLVLIGVAVIAIGLSSVLGNALQASEASDMVGPRRPFLSGFLVLTMQSGPQLGGSSLLILGTYLFSVLGQELFFRVYLQPRLAHYLPGRWALFVQAALFYAANLLPLYLLTGGDLPVTFALTQAVVLSNGVLAGYFWRKTGSLPLLILLHLLAFSRWGL